MNVKEVYEYFGNSSQFAKKTGLSSGNIWTWEKQGFIPMRSQRKIEELTSGALKAAVEESPYNLDEYRQSVSSIKIAIPIYLYDQIKVAARSTNKSISLWIKECLEEEIQNDY